MAHNQHLNEIFYLIEKYDRDEKINHQDLKKIEKLVNDMTSGNHVPPEILSDKIPDLQAKGYVETFETYFSHHPRLNKGFVVKSTLFAPSISTQTDTILRLVTYNNEYEIVYEFENQFYLVDTTREVLNQITPAELQTYTNDFDASFGLELDANLSMLTKGRENHNTRIIVIPYAGNFDGMTPSENLDIYLFPGIINIPTREGTMDRYTFVMSFLSDEIIGFTDFYDTFELCPPNNLASEK
uniref:hypothetical protein n=1 Tax=Flavobacterium sp. TaxID=239 RepID=UPI00404A5907